MGRSAAAPDKNRLPVIPMPTALHALGYFGRVAGGYLVGCWSLLMVV